MDANGRKWMQMEAVLISCHDYTRMDRPVISLFCKLQIYQDMPKRVTTTSGNSDAKQAREPDCQSPLNQLCAVPVLPNCRRQRSSSYSIPE